MANGNAYKHFVASTAEVNEKKPYNIVGGLALLTFIILIIFM